MSEVNVDHLRSLFDLLDRTQELHGSISGTTEVLKHAVDKIQLAIFSVAQWEYVSGFGFGGYAPRLNVLRGVGLAYGAEKSIEMIRKEYII